MQNRSALRIVVVEFRTVRCSCFVRKKTESEHLIIL
jgi:hypothetical protein